MPYDYDPNLQTDDDKNQSGGGQGQGQTQLAGSGAIAGGATSTAAAPAPGGGAQSKGGNTYENLNAYLDANSGNGFGGQFAGKVQGDVSAATDAQAQGAKQFQGASDAGTTKENQGLVDSALSDPTTFSADPSQVAAFKAQKNANYSGPQTYSDDQSAYQTAYGATQKASDVANASQSEGGRFSLLNNYFGTPDYTQGQKSLDNLLVSGDTQAQQSLAQAKQNANQAQLSFQAQAPVLSDYAAQNAAATAQANQYANTQGNAATTAEQQRQAALVAKYQADQQAALANANNVLGGKDTSQYAGLINQFGVQQGAAWTPQDWNGTQLAEAAPGHDTGYWGLDPSKFIQQGGSPTLDNSTTAADQAKLQALQGLMDQNQTQYASGQAGTYDPTKPYGFNTTDYNASLTQAQQSYAAQEAAIHNNLQSILSQPLALGMRGTNGSSPFSPQQAYASQIQDQIDRLNNLRASYGLGAVSNPYINNSAPFGTAPSAPVL